jgi:leucyl aminopeptidase (aminopeptidase T)
MLARLMACDFPTLQRRSRALAKLLTRAGEAHFTCPRGSDMTLDLRGREGIADDGDLSTANAFGNLPCGEGFIAPLGGEGTLVASTLASIGLSAEDPVTLTVRDGRLAEASGRRASSSCRRWPPEARRESTSPSSASGPTSARR